MFQLIFLILSLMKFFTGFSEKLFSHLIVVLQMFFANRCRNVGSLISLELIVSASIGN